MPSYISKQQHPSEYAGDASHISNPEGFESYVLKHIIGRGSHSVVHLATCARGRLRGRDVALKFMPRSLCTPALESMHLATTALHKSLHHPALVSLYSAFTVTEHHCLVLELCKGGSLWDFLRCQTKDPIEELAQFPCLDEAQIRPVLRTVIEGLSYLHSRGIMHQNINTRKIFLTADGHAKLGGFGRTCPSMLSTKSCNNVTTVNTCFSELAVTESPSCTFQPDLRSLGYLMIALLTGTPPSDVENRPKHFTSLNAVLGNLKCSQDAEAVITALLGENPEQRYPLTDIISLPFFDSTQPTQFLNLEPSVHPNKPSQDPKTRKNHRAPPVRRQIQVHLDAQQTQEENTTSNRATATKRHQPHEMPAIPTAKPTANPTPPIESCRSSFHPGSSNMRSTSIRDAWTRLAVRQKPAAITAHDNGAMSTSGISVAGPSVPALSNPRKMRRKPLAEVGNLEGHSTSDEAGVKTNKNCSMASGLLSPPETQFKGTPPRSEPIIVAPPLTSPPPSPPPPRPDGFMYSSGSSPHVPPTNIPKAFKVSPLFPRTHKLAHGQVVVLPSHSLLIDLREGERRVGGRGDRVICVSADGQEISLYNAPHLSTPCILSEPLAKWTLPMLPSRYWETYSFAGKFLESVKKRTPWLVWYTTQAKIMLMANGPPGDVHAIFPCPPPETNRRRADAILDRDTETFTQMRIALSRGRSTVEVSRRGAGDKWITKSGAHPGGVSQMSLAENEKTAMKCVLAALKVCEFVEAQRLPQAGPLANPSEAAVEASGRREVEIQSEVEGK